MPRLRLLCDAGFAKLTRFLIGQGRSQHLTGVEIALALRFMTIARCPAGATGYFEVII